MCPSVALSPSSTRRQDVPPRDSPPPTSQGGSINCAEDYIARKTKEETDHLLAKLEKEGLEIDGKVAGIIGNGIARIEAQAARENLDDPKKDRMRLLLVIGAMAVGFFMGMEWQENIFRQNFAKRRRAILCKTE